MKNQNIFLFFSMLCFAVAFFLIGLLYRDILKPPIVQGEYYLPTFIESNTPAPTITPTLIPSSTPKPPDWPTVTPSPWQPYFTQMPLFTPFTLEPAPLVQPPTPEYGFIVPTDIPTEQATPIPNYGYYDPSYLIPWQPYIEPTLGATINFDLDLDLDYLFSIPNAIASQLPECVYPLPAPFVTWDMAERAANLQADRHDSEEISIPSSAISAVMAEGFGYFPTDGNIRIPENGIIAMLSTYQDIQSCRQADGNPSLFGPGIQIWLNDLYALYKE